MTTPFVRGLAQELEGPCDDLGLGQIGGILERAAASVLFDMALDPAAGDEDWHPISLEHAEDMTVITLESGDTLYLTAEQTAYLRALLLTWDESQGQSPG